MSGVKGKSGVYIRTKPPWNKGKKTPYEVCQKLSKSHMGKHNSLKTEFKKGHIPWIKGKPHLRGDKHPMWKGGLTSLRDRMKNHFIYYQWRSDVFTRDDFTCRKCNKRGGDLEAHHIRPVWVIFEKYQIKTMNKALNCKELWDINNGRTLCKKCHKKYYNRREVNMGKFQQGDIVEISGHAKIIKVEEIENRTYYEVTINDDNKIIRLPEEALYKLPEPKDFQKCSCEEPAIRVYKNRVGTWCGRCGNSIEEERDLKDIIRSDAETYGDTGQDKPNPA